jgi:cell division protein FtsQ
VPALKRKSSRKPARRPTRRKVLPKNMKAALRIALPVALVGALIGAGGWAWHSGAAARLVAAASHEITAASVRLGLSVNNVMVVGRKRAGRDEVARALGAKRGAPILAFDPHAAKTRLEKLNWVRAAMVERRLPDTIYLRLSEREPMALWQAEGRLALIDREGVVIKRTHLGRWRNLPMVVGSDAAAGAEAIIEIVSHRPAVAEMVSAMVRVSGRRWDLRLKGGVIAQLPEDGAARAVAQLAELIARDRILQRDIVAIDLRLPDRLVVRTRTGTRPHSDADAGKATKPGTKPGKDT